MRHKRQVEVPASTRTETFKKTCDLCQADCQIDRSWGEVDRVKIQREVGDSWPEGTNLTVTEVDLCGPCFENKLLPWLRAQGAIVAEHEVEY